MKPIKTIRNILIIALALLLQSVLFGRYAIWGVKPDFAMLLLIFLVSDSDEAVSGILYGFIIGFICDMYSPDFLGANSFTMSLMGFFLGLIRERLTVEHYSVKAFVTFIACLVHDVIFLSFYTKFNHSMMLNLFIRESISGAVYTSVILVIMFILWEWIISGGVYFVARELFGNRR